MAKSETDKRTHNGPQNTTQKMKGSATWSSLKLGVNSGAREGQVVPAPHVAHVVILVLQEEFEDTNEVIKIRTSKKGRQHNHCSTSPRSLQVYIISIIGRIDLLYLPIRSYLLDCGMPLCSAYNSC
jgi:hypothetical protein